MTSKISIIGADKKVMRLYNQTSMHTAMAKLLLLPQFFGIFPLHGVTGQDVKDVEFKWTSFRMFYAFYCIFGGTVMTAFCFTKFALYGLMLNKTATFAFYFCNVCGAMQFIKIAKNWPTIIKQWLVVDIAMRRYGFPHNLHKKFKIITTIFLSLAVCEHTLFIFNNLNFALDNRDFSELLEYSRKTENFTAIYFTVTFPHVFELTEYTLVKAVFSEISNVLMTFAWNYTDLFIIILSTSLALRFKQINERLETTKIVNEKFWREVREDYNRLSRLCWTIDKHICTLVILSFTNNLFFICVQLYNSIKPRSGFLEGTYFFYSFGFLLARTLTVTLHAAWINDESRKPLDVLHSIPTEYFNKEVNRFIEQIYTLPVGITGCKCFLVTRGLILKLAGTIVTFELMLLQFGPLLLLKKEQTLTNSTNVNTTHV